MGVQDYPRMSITDFGDALLERGDLDPVYNALQGGGVRDNHLARWLLAYWCCYNAGLSSWLSDQEGPGAFWAGMEEFAWNNSESPIGGRWPRGRERRHFRGDKCVQAVRQLRMWFPFPELAVVGLSTCSRFQDLRTSVMRWPLFGPWIAFKVGDMMERVMGCPVSFEEADVFMFDSPRKAAVLWAGGAAEAVAIPSALDHLRSYFGDRPAPPRADRKMNIQEFETILCKWGSHMTGHYPVGIDTRELREALHHWSPYSITAKAMLASIPGRQEAQC